MTMVTRDQACSTHCSASFKYNEMQGKLFGSVWTTNASVQFVSPLLLLLWMGLYVQ
jgi:hypothetical protein